MSESTVRLHRVLRADPERVYKAFLDPEALVKWLPPYGFTAKVHGFEARVGGSFRMSFCHFASGQSHTFSGEYLELEPGRRIRYQERFDSADLPGEMRTTIVLRQVACGTEMDIVQEGIPEVIPVHDCYLGWQQSLMQLALLVEPEIPV
jgi:uncharacterized protein YndB with AHSA1/START domain